MINLYHIKTPKWLSVLILVTGFLAVSGCVQFADSDKNVAQSVNDGKRTFYPDTEEEILKSNNMIDKVETSEWIDGFTPTVRVTVYTSLASDDVEKTAAVLKNIINAIGAKMPESPQSFQILIYDKGYKRMRINSIAKKIGLIVWGNEKSPYITIDKNNLLDYLSES